MSLDPQLVQRLLDSMPVAPGSVPFLPQAAPTGSVPESRTLPSGRKAQVTVGHFDGMIYQALALLVAALGDNTDGLGALLSALEDLNGTELKGNGLLDALTKAVGSLGLKVDAQTTAVGSNSGKLDTLAFLIQTLTTTEGTLGLKLDVLAAKEQATVDRLTDLATLNQQTLTAQRNAAQSTGFWQGRWTASNGGDVDLGTVASVDRTVYGLGPSSGSSLLVAILANLVGGMADVQLFHVDPAGVGATQALRDASKAFGGAAATVLGDPVSLGPSQPLVWLGFGMTLPAGRQLRAHCNAGNVRLNVRVA